MLAPAALKSLSPLFITPCYSGQVTSAFATSMIGLTNTLWNLGVQGSIRIRSGESLVTRARNEALAHFLANKQFTHLFWIDADIGFSADQAVRLLQADLDVVTGVYPLKRIDWTGTIPEGLTKDEFLTRALRYPVNTTTSIDARIDADGFMEVSEAPTGFMCIKRAVLETMIARMPELAYVPDAPPDSPLHGHCYRFFDVMVEAETNRYLSEDYAFCRRWRDLGGKIHVDTQSKLAHHGSYTYRGDFGAAFAQDPTRAVGGQ
jgi:hypothetical protein